MAFKRVESTFAPLPDNQYTMYATEAKFIISKQKQTPGVNVKLKVNDVDENGAPQANAGRTIFNTFWLTEKTLGMFCQWLDALGFKTDDNGNYLMEDGSIMPDPTDPMLAPDTILPHLVGIPFVVKTKHSVNEYTKEDGSAGSNDQYRLSYVYKNKRPILSKLPKKTEAFTVPATPDAPSFGDTLPGVPGKPSF